MTTSPSVFVANARPNPKVRRRLAGDALAGPHSYRTWALVFLFLFFPLRSFGAKDDTAALWEPHPSKSGSYTEQWSISLWADNGAYVHIQYLISAVGLGDQSAFKIEITEADGKRTSLKQKTKPRFSREDEELRLCAERHCITAYPERFDLEAKIGEATLTLQAFALAPSFKPGAPLLHDSGGDYDIVLIMPKARFTGALVSKERTLSLSGVGMLDHSWTTLAPHKLAKRWFRVKTVSSTLSCLLTGVTRPGSARDVDSAWMWFDDGAGRRVVAREVKVRFAKTETDAESKARYQLPQEVTVEARGEDGKRLTLLIRDGVQTKRKPFLKGLGFFERMLVGSLSEPIEYTYSGEFEFALHDASPGAPRSALTLTRKRDYSLQMINP